jgi:hypothetical protein
MPTSSFAADDPCKTVEKLIAIPERRFAYRTHPNAIALVEKPIEKLVIAGDDVDRYSVSRSLGP